LKTAGLSTAARPHPGNGPTPVCDETLGPVLEKLYSHYNHSKHIHPDPLEFVYRYKSSLDMELSGFIASALAYGRVRQILRSVSTVLNIMDPSPSGFLLEQPPSRICKPFEPFKHRFTSGDMLSCLLIGLRELVLEHGSLESCFLAGFRRTDQDILPALAAFVKKLEQAAGRKMPMFLPSPEGGSACKRLNLFLRWMVRKDNVDPGIWRSIPESSLIVPLDTHMHRIATAMGLTSRKQADIRCAVEITAAFRSIRPADPVRYDFALTRLGMNAGRPPSDFSYLTASIGGNE
jgi:uncharacterized protein (TIGR02757 family)